MKCKCIEKIFSIKNDQLNKEKVITVLGKQFKFKSKRLIQRENEFLTEKLEEILISNNEMLSKLDVEYTPIENRLCYCLSMSLPYRTTGYATRSQYMAKAMNEKFDLYVVTKPNFPWNANSETRTVPTEMVENIDGIRYIRQQTTSKENIITEMIESWVKTFLELRPQYVVAASDYVNALPVMVAAKKLGIPFYYEVRGFWELTRVSANPSYKDTLKFKYEKFSEARVCKNADGVFTLTTPMKNELVSRGVSEDKISLAPNCADLSLFDLKDKNTDLLNRLNIPQDVPVIGYIGSIQVYEGIDDLMRACATLNDKNIDFRLLIIGSSRESFDYKKQLCDLAEELKIGNKLIMLDRVDSNEVADYYSLIDIAPFGRKPFDVCELVSPIKPLEAMAMQKTVIVSDVGALKEIVIDNETGLHFKKGDVNSYAEVLERAIVDSDLRKQLGINARQWIEQNRQWSMNIDRMKEVFNKNIEVK